MTSDAKIGLLLGLVFIVIIAFIINGLPNFFKSDEHNEAITTSITNSKQDSLLIGRQADETVKVINTVEVSQPGADYDDVRFTIELPSPKTVSERSEKKLSRQYVQKADIKTYIVQPGDNLAVIAKKVYGPERGNKNAVVEKIFEANRKILASADRITVGLELNIPPLLTVQDDSSGKKVIPVAGILEKIKALSNEKLSVLKNATRWRSRKASEYVVRSGDNLWQIASRFLGDGNRYDEVLKLNRDVIDDADDISVGMCLKLPHR